MGIQMEKNISRSVPGVTQEEKHGYQWKFKYMWRGKKSTKNVWIGLLFLYVITFHLLEEIYTQTSPPDLNQGASRNEQLQELSPSATHKRWLTGAYERRIFIRNANLVPISEGRNHVDEEGGNPCQRANGDHGLWDGWTGQTLWWGIWGGYSAGCWTITGFFAGWRPK
jgi:hypothetical protein